MKEKFLNKKIISLFLAITIVLPFIGDTFKVIPNIFSDLFASEVINNEEIRILEIQPGNKFSLGKDKTAGINKHQKIQGKDVKIDHIPMPEFIGKIEELNGYYDVIFIGNINTELTEYTKNYSHIKDGEKEYEGSGRKTKVNGNYVENDITEKKADEIIEFIKTGQLVYVDKSIIGNESNIKESILYKKFNVSKNPTINGYSNYIYNQSLNNKSLVDIVKKYTDNENKRTQVTIDVSGGDTKSYDENNKLMGNNNDPGKSENRKLKYTIKFSENIGNVDIKLYLDMNGDGLFKDKEIYNVQNKISTENSYELNYELDSNFVGLLDWKVEIEQSNGIKSYLIGNMYFKSLKGEKKQIRVLQVHPTDNNLTDLKNKKEVQDLKDHEISIDYKTNEEFDKTAGKSLKLNGNYDMIILGFSDMFGAGGKTRNQIKNKSAMDELKLFISSGQSVMFTHDTMAFNPPDGSIELTKNFRDYLGQSRFVDLYRKEGGKIDESDIYRNYNIMTGEYEDRDIPHHILSKEGIYGYTLNAGGGFKRSKKIYKTNNALITTYPYEVGDMPVSETHNQWFQLNLEDPDVVPWYTLSENQNKYDVRNSYYTYSKGNLTFSGAGHSKNYNTEELRLFVNTIVKAERGANHAPTISSNLDLDIVQEVSANSNFDFEAVVKDIDNDKVNVKISIKKADGTWDTLKTSNKIEQGTPVNQVIDKEKYENRINKEIEIKVEATDIQGAKTEAIYKIKPIIDPIVVPEVTGGNGLVGDDINFNIKLTKENENKNQPIKDVSLQVEKYNTNVIKNINTKKENINFNKESKVENTNYIFNTNTATNDQIGVKLEYKVGSETKTQTIWVNISSKKGEVVLKVVDSVGNILSGFEGQAKLTSSKTQYPELTMKGLHNGRYTWPDSDDKKILTDTYKLKLTSEGTNYEVDNYKVINSSGKEVIGDGQEASIGTINYNNPKVEVLFKVNRRKPIDTTSNDELRILEVQPGNEFELTRKEDKTTAGTEQITGEDINTSNGNNITNIVIDHIPMPEFIGKVDQLNGLYDVIVIGRYVSSDSNSRDYSHIINDGKENEGHYVENDITSRKCKEIENFLQTGQIVYLQNTINDNDIKNSNLYDLFNKVKNKVNLKKYDTIELQNIIDNYKNNENKRPIIEVDSPLGDQSSHIWKDGEDRTKDVLGSYENRNMEYVIRILETKGYSGNYNIKLFLDVNGDGRYEEDEVFKEDKDKPILSEGYRLVYDMPIDFIGQLNWKIEIEKVGEENVETIKSYVTGIVNFRRTSTNNKRIIEVLQISPNKGLNTETGLDLSDTDSNFTMWKDKVKDYEINITTVTVSDYDKRANSSYMGNDKITLNGNYDMVILGFSNVYGNEDIKNKSSLDQLKKFIEAGQGVMFTHDTMIYDEYGSNAPQNIRKLFRDYVGQTRFMPTIKEEKSESEKDLIDNYVDLGNYNKKIWGYSRYKDKIQTATKVQQTNSALITDYPYDLSVADEVNAKGITEIKPNELSIRKTHTQWFQLNFEDPEVVPWYNIKGDNDVYDSRNSYYTYSKGNITFSGTGEDSYEDSKTYPNSEMQLFVNTIIKAERGANHAPIIDSTIPEKPKEEYDLEIDKNKDYTFKARATDIDNDKVNLQVSVKNKSNNKWEIIRPYSKEYINQGEYLSPDTRIDSSILQDNSEEILEVKIEAKDEHGAISTKTYRLLPTNNPQLTIIPEEGKGLVGEVISANVNLSKVNMQGSNDIKINKISIGEYDNSIFSNITLPNISNLVYDNNETSITVKARTISESDKFLPIIIEYQVYKTNGGGVGDIYTPKTIEIKIPISSKKGEVNLNIINEDNEVVKPNVTLNNGDKEISTVNMESMSYTWPNNLESYILSGSYSIKINNLQQLGATIVEEKGQNSKVNYDNPKATIEIKISTGRDGQVISHGIFSKSNNKYAITEAKPGIDVNIQNIIKGMYYTIGTEVNVLRNNSQLNITLENVQDLDSSKVFLYEVSGENTIKEIDLQDNISVDGNVIRAINLSKNKKYMVVYSAKFNGGADLKSELINLNENSSKILKLQITNSTESTDGLPELF